MEKFCSIIYANRDRDPARINLSFDSLSKQSISNFEVIFVDYGSDPKLVSEYKKLSEPYDFVKFFSLEVSHLLWNKSKALNFGIAKSETPFIFIADVDLIFHSDSLNLFQNLSSPKKFFLFKLGYLDKKVSQNLAQNHSYDTLVPVRYGNVNGMILVSQRALLEVNGLDEFFHFYGAEDEDLFARLEMAGYVKEEQPNEYFYHNWHKSFSAGNDRNLSLKPRIKNAMRLNQRHFFSNMEHGIIKPLGQKEISKSSEIKVYQLKDPDFRKEIKNILAHVEHFLRVELPSLKGKVVEVQFSQAPYYNSLKHHIKKIIGRDTQPLISMKTLNDMVLKEIIFNYRDHYYSYRISEDYKNIIFRICL